MPMDCDDNDDAYDCKISRSFTTTRKVIEKVTKGPMGSKKFFTLTKLPQSSKATLGHILVEMDGVDKSVGGEGESKGVGGSATVCKWFLLFANGFRCDCSIMSLNMLIFRLKYCKSLSKRKDAYGTEHEIKSYLWEAKKRLESTYEKKT
ncbi:hypothetical protein Tco_0507997 [Tanacetum coccineum]